MSMRRTWVGVSAAVACAVAVACGADGKLASEMLADAGEVLVDAGRALVDAGGQVGGGADAQVPGGGGASSARASETHEVACTDALVRTVQTGGTTVRTVVRVAEVLTRTSDITGVDAITCGKEGATGPESCPTGSTCSGSAQLVAADCVAGNGWVSLEPSKVRVYCGQYSQINGAASLTQERWKTARITIRR